MDGENNGKPYEQMDDLGGNFTPIFWKHPCQEGSFLDRLMGIPGFHRALHSESGSTSDAICSVYPSPLRNLHDITVIRTRRTISSF